MVNEINILDKIKQAAGMSPGDLLTYGLILLAVLATAYVAWKILRGRSKQTVAVPPALDVQVTGLGTAGPPPGPPVLEYYHYPVRLAAIVLAPAGRTRELPPLDKLGGLVDLLVPGLAPVVALHQPLVRRWPPQLSVRGFAHSFFVHARLPGQGGKGTPWCSVAGVFRVDNQPVMAGLVLRAASNVHLGQQIVDNEGKWQDVLRVKISG
jgi:hypothetical protein